MQRRVLKIATLSAAIGVPAVVYFWRRIKRAELEKLVRILNWHAGAIVADVGTGSGAFALKAADRVGASGRVFATDVDRKKLKRIQGKSLRRGASNIVIGEANDDRSGLPPACCDSILLRGAYHHFSRPSAMAADLFQALRPGGVLAVIEFPPRWWLSLIAPLKQAPANRGGHGIPRNLLILELTAAGFELYRIIPRWFLDTYCVVFHKPSVPES